ncbi:hypothetical protein, partial [Flavobacterium sp.]|uniref:hypothetical protein n=1 Tax=Flavobacterium sp. TaxID=239 RepID=UPI002B4AE96A
MKKFLRNSGFLTTVFLIVNLFFTSVTFGQATVTTDKDDYMPGDQVVITGTSWFPGEQVSISIKEIPSNNAPIEYSAVADAEGNVLMDQFVTLQSHLGKAFFVTATGNTSLEIALSHFTDASFTSTANGNWNSPATWGFTGSPAPVQGVNYPGPLDVVTITKNNAITLSANATCQTLNISASTTANGTSSLNMGGFNLTVGGWLNLISSQNNRTVSLTTNGGTLSLAQLNLTTGGSGNPGIATFTLSNNSTLNVSDLISSTGIGNSFTISSPSTVNYNGSGNQNIFAGFTYHNLSLSGSGIKTFATSTTINGNLSINGSVIANLGTFSHTATTLTLGGLGTASGTWGSTSSSPLANHTNNTYFSSTIGKVTVGADTKGSSTITATGTTSFIYSGLPQGPTTSIETGSAGAITYSYSGVLPTVYSASVTRPINAGTYQVTATVAADDNYNGATSTPLTFTIGKAATT